jgi:membrane protease YdiL (CAAX protease family)
MTSAPGGSAGRRTALGAVVFAAVAPSLAALWYFHGADSPAAAQVIYFATKAAISCFPLLWWMTAERCRADPAPIVSRGRDLLWGAAGGLLIGAFLWAGFALQVRGWIDPGVLRERVREFGAYDRFVPLALFLSAVNSGLEEYYWRWFVFGRLRGWCPLGTAMGLGGLAFAAHHFVALEHLLQNPGLAALLCAGIMLGGVIWSWQYQRTGRLLGVWLSHCLVDLAVLSCAYTLLF